MNYPEAHTDSAPRPRAFLVRSVYLRVLVLGREGPQYGVHLLRRAAIPVTLFPVTGQPMNVLAVVHRFTTFETRSLDCKVLRTDPVVSKGKARAWCSEWNGITALAPLIGAHAARSLQVTRGVEDFPGPVSFEEIDDWGSDSESESD